MNKRRDGFTLVEILVVLGIIAILAALLFPAFGRARESARQTTCQSNLQQIYFAVSQYRKDEGRYPDALVDLLGEGAKFDDGSAGGGTLTSQTATGYLKAGQDSLICKDDDYPNDIPRSSYGSLNKALPATLAAPAPTTFTGDFSRYVWNYWGYRDDGFSYISPTEVQTAVGTSCASATPCLTLANPNANFSSGNPVKYSMSNRFAPTSTIITHCVYHRLPTANNLNGPGDLYGAAPLDSSNARDLVLRIDGSVKAVDVSLWKSNKTWQNQTP